MLVAQEAFTEELESFFTDDPFLLTVVVVLGAIVLWLVVRRFGRKAVARIPGAVPTDPVALADYKQRVDTMWALIRRVLLLTLLLIVVLTLMAIWDIPIAPFLAIGGAIGVALGFGAQDLVKDIIAGFFIVAEDQFSIGDTVAVAGISGTVQDLQLRITVVRDLDGIVHYVPNGEIKVSSNYTQEFSAVVLDIGVAYSEDVDNVVTVLGRILDEFVAEEDWGSLVLEDPEILGVQELGDSAVTIRVRLVSTPEDRWSLRRELLRRVKIRFDAEGIEIPFPHRTVVPGDVEAWKAALGESTP
jgi:small conductance mechanosensitive channel